METVGLVTKIKLASFLTGGPNSFDVCAVTLTERGTGTPWLFYLWNSRDDAPAVIRILETQRLALVREAAFRKQIVHLWHDDDSSVIFEVEVDIR